VLGREHLETAKRHLQQFAVVGVTDRFVESFVQMRRTLGLRMPFFVTRNVAPPSQPLRGEEVELIREHNALDLELYEFARNLYVRDGLSFGLEVRAVRWTSRTLSKFRR
jgi:hypothetical protein